MQQQEEYNKFSVEERRACLKLMPKMQNHKNKMNNIKKIIENPNFAEQLSKNELVDIVQYYAEIDRSKIESKS